MSYERGWAALNLKMPDTIPHTEYCSHPGLVRHITGIDPNVDGSAWRKFMEITDYDILWYSNDGPEWKGRLTNMGHAVFAEGGTDYNSDIQCPFKTPEDVLDFDPVKEYGVPDIDERAKFFTDIWKAEQGASPFLVCPGGYYRTVVSACIAAFGWEMFLSAAPLDYEKFGRVLDGFAETTMANVKAWAKTDIKFFIQHDDMVWTEGAIFHPEWYRKYVFPKYKKFWKVLKDAGKIVLFCSDGNFTEFVDDIAGAGADGFIFEPLTDLKYIVEKYGKTKVIVGNIDTRALTFGTKEAVKAEVERCYDLGRKCPGYFFAVGNHIPHNIPLENALYYLELIRDRRR